MWIYLWSPYLRLKKCLGEEGRKNEQNTFFWLMQREQGEKTCRKWAKFASNEEYTYTYIHTLAHAYIYVRIGTSNCWIESGTKVLYAVPLSSERRWACLVKKIESHLLGQKNVCQRGLFKLENLRYGLMGRWLNPLTRTNIRRKFRLWRPQRPNPE